MSFDIKQKAKKLNMKYVFAIVLTVIAIAFVSLFTPIYSISEISVDGNSVISADIIARASGIEIGNSFFEVNTRDAAEKVGKVSYVDTVKVRRVFPDKIKIIITESTESAYVSFAGNFIGIDHRGKILEVRQQTEEIIKPVVNGVNISNFTIGNYIDIEDNYKKELLFELISAINEENLGESIHSIDITDTENIFLIMRNTITVKFGSYANIRYKTAYLKTVLAELTEETGGVLDISDTENVKYIN